MLEEADIGVMLWLLRKVVWDAWPCASPAEEAGLTPAPGTEKGLSGAAPVTEGELPWGVRHLLGLLFKKEPRLPRLFRLCSPADAPGLCAAPDNYVCLQREEMRTKQGKLNSSELMSMLPISS